VLCVANQRSDVATSTIEGRLSKKIKNVEQTVDGLQSSVRTMGRDLKDVGPRRPSIGGPAAEELGDLTDATAEKAAIDDARAEEVEKRLTALERKEEDRGKSEKRRAAAKDVGAIQVVQSGMKQLKLDVKELQDNVERRCDGLEEREIEHDKELAKAIAAIMEHLRDFEATHMQQRSPSTRPQRATSEVVKSMLEELKARPAQRPVGGKDANEERFAALENLVGDLSSKDLAEKIDALDERVTGLRSGGHGPIGGGDSDDEDALPTPPDSEDEDEPDPPFEDEKAMVKPPSAGPLREPVDDDIESDGDEPPFDPPGAEVATADQPEARVHTRTGGAAAREVRAAQEEEQEEEMAPELSSSGELQPASSGDEQQPAIAPVGAQPMLATATRQLEAVEAAEHPVR
jgi:hypothetical protein